ncbi:MAG: asparagine synthase (glutamine-hydrolyzing) [Lentisphaerales bacterium]|nr:asparagine synthase (glutamine-hydrolyzing) [Lentisphaerales bacterium]
MCGISGIVKFSNQSISHFDSQRLKESLESMKSRGPNAQALCQGENWALGLTRLSIIDLDGGNQPMKDTATGVTLSYNGEIYNYLELKEDLLREGCTFVSESDTEVLLKSYIHWGKAALNKLNGCFAFAVYDPRDESLFVARDRLGVKPFYYNCEGSQLNFASSVAALIKIIGKRSLEPSAISHYFTSCRITFGEKTFLKGVNTLLPATCMKVDLNTGSVQKEKYWSRPTLAPQDKQDVPQQELLYRTSELIKSAVEDRLVSDVPVGCFLSGGLDSAIVARLATGGVRKYPFFCAGSTVEKYNEFKYAKEVADSLGCPVQDIRITPDTFFTDWQNLIDIKGLPLSTPNETSIYRLSKALKETCSVTLTGEGADEVFGGYLMPLFGIYDYLKAPHSEEASLGHALEYKLMQRFGRSFIYNEADHFFLTHSWMPADRKARFFSEGFWQGLDEDDEVFSFYEDFLDKHLQCSPFDRRLHLHAEVNLEGLLNRVDSSTMAASVEARVPFTDYRVVEFAFKQVDSWKMAFRNSAAESQARDLLVDEINQRDLIETKRLIRQAFAKDVPQVVIDRPKMSFPTPFQEWLSGGFVSELEDRCLKISREMEIFNEAEVKAMFSRGDRNLWLLANVCLWYEAVCR